MPYQYGIWWMVILNTVIFIVFAFSFFKPKSAVDWGAFGGFSAFLVALFTEMYGFPLTLFLLAPWLQAHFPGINPFAHNTGMLWNIVFGIDPGNPMFSWWHMVSMVIIGAGVILIFEAWQALLAAHKENKLATTRLYRYVRHPQYDGFLLVMIGYFMMWPTIITAIMLPILVVMYIRLAKVEERSVEKEFGEEYKKYKQVTPAFIPNLKRQSA